MGVWTKTAASRRSSACLAPSTAAALRTLTWGNPSMPGCCDLVAGSWDKRAAVRRSCLCEETTPPNGCVQHPNRRPRRPRDRRHLPPHRQIFQPYRDTSASGDGSAARWHVRWDRLPSRFLRFPLGCVPLPGFVFRVVARLRMGGDPCDHSRPGPSMRGWVRDGQQRREHGDEDPH